MTCIETRDGHLAACLQLCELQVEVCPGVTNLSDSYLCLFFRHCVVFQAPVFSSLFVLGLWCGSIKHLKERNSV